MAAMASGLPVAAVRLGELKVHSALGEALDASITLKPAAGETLGPECFRLGSARSRRLLLDSRATFAVSPAGSAPRLRIRTAAPINEPALQVRISAACPGGRATTRDYEFLFVPRAALAPPAAATPAAPREPGFRSLPGDTLASLAAAIYPKDAAARDAYLQALRRDNAALATLGAEEPIPVGTILVLPDLHEFARTLPRSPGAAAPRKAAAAPSDKPPAPALSPAPKTDAAKTAAKADSATRAPKAGTAKPVPRAPLPAARVPAGAPFALRLSAPELDLGRSRNVDERTRAQLRERRLALDADDKVAALLALKHSVKQLEGRVAELQLRLATSTAAAPKDAPPAPARAPATPVAAATAPRTPETKSVEPAKPAPQPTAATPPPKAAAPAPAPTPVQAPAPAKAPDKAPAASTARAPATPQPGVLDDIPPWLWGLLAALVAIIGALGWLRFRRRDTQQEAAPAAPAAVSELDEAEALMRGGEDVEHFLLPADNGRAVADSDAGLATRIGGTDPATLRRRYIEERFPEIAGGTIVLDDPDSVVKAARLFYEDGAIPRAVELLQFAVEEQPAAMKPWLALFEIFRLEALAGEFGTLAARFREHHGASENWQKVQFIGRELDPQDPLYHDAPQAHLETIGPLQAARAAVTFDPLSENWLNAPMDFTSDALAATLRSALLADAGMQEADLAQDPMPALKNVEMFNVA